MTKFDCYHIRTTWQLAFGGNENSIENFYAQSVKYNNAIIMGNFNARIGHFDPRNECRISQDKKTNSLGTVLIPLITEQGLHICNERFRREFYFCTSEWQWVQCCGFGPQFF